jgi:hypothetical protein
MTLRTTLHLTCDDCGNPYPACGVCPSPVDGAIFSAQELRREAHLQKGWTRPNSGTGRIDLCARCTKKARKTGASR